MGTNVSAEFSLNANMSTINANKRSNVNFDLNVPWIMEQGKCKCDRRQRFCSHQILVSPAFNSWRDSHHSEIIEMNHTSTEIIRVGRECSPYLAWTSPAPNGTYWHGPNMMLVKSMMPYLPPMEFIYHLEMTGDYLPAIQALIDNRIDIDPEPYNMFDWRYQVVDFAYPNLMENSEFHILSAKQYQSPGEVINGVFDTLSYILLIVSTLFLGVVLGLHSRRNNKQEGSLKVIENGVIGAVGLMLKQDPIRSVRMGNILVQVMIKLYSLFVTCMYASVVTAILTAKVEVEQINTLDDLLLPQFQHLSIMTQTTVERMLKTLPVYEKIQPRLRFYSAWDPDHLPDPVQIVKAVAEGRQVMIDSWPNLVRFVEDDSPPEISCKYPLSGFAQSRDAFPGSLPVSWAYRKGFRYAEAFDKARMWLEAYGLFTTITPNKLASKTDHAVFVPETVDIPCPPLPTTPPSLEKCPPSVTDEPLILTHVRSLFVYYAWCMGFSFLVFWLEHFIWRL